jgi:hypothetical protein
MNLSKSSQRYHVSSLVDPAVKENLRNELSKLPGKLKAKLVVEALEGARKNGLAAVQDRPNIAHQNKVSEAVILELLKEFKANLDKNISRKHAGQEDIKIAKAPTQTEREVDKTVHNSEHAISLQRENPVIAAALLVRIGTVDTVTVLQKLPPSHSQRIALQLVEIDRLNHKIPRKSQELIDEIHGGQPAVC